MLRAKFYLWPMTSALRALIVLAICASAATAMAQVEGFTKDDFALSAPTLFVKGIQHEVELTCLSPEKLGPYGQVLPIVVNGQKVNARFVNHTALIPVVFDRVEPFSLKAGGFTHVSTVRPMPLWWSVVPPLLVIVLALVFREVVGSLLGGIFTGAMVTGYYSTGSWAGMGRGFFTAIDGYLVDALYDRGHISVILFSTVIGGIVALISKNGGMQAVVNRVSRKARNAQSGQLATWFLGVAIFFDDYANTLVVGNTMRSITDRLRISREKLAYIVDSTAAPVAAIALITTWIGAELGYIQGALDTISTGEGPTVEMGAYSVFLHSLEYAFYPIFALALILIIVFSGRDYGPMFKAEIKARLDEGVQNTAGGPAETDEFAPVEGAPFRMANALIPIAIVVFGTMAGLFVTGYDSTVWSDPELGFGARLSVTIGDSDSYQALLWSSVCGLIAAVLLTTFQGIMSYGKAIETSIDGFKSMVNAVVILILAWALAALTKEMYTADYLAGLAGDAIAPWAIPAIAFVIAAVVSFSTGSAWGTMAIVYPLMLPLTWELSIASGLAPEEALPLFFNVTSCVLAGAVLGDHCSPISDTTILSSLATRCDHMAHVRTQLPYALTAGAVAIAFTTLSAVASVPWYLNFPLGIALLIGIVRVLGRRVEPGV